MEEQIELLWEFLESRKYHIVRDNCQEILAAIEKDLAGGFGQDMRTAALYRDKNKKRRESYLEVLKVYGRALRSLVVELIIQTDNINDIDQNFQNYQSLRHDIRAGMSKVAYLSGHRYRHKTFISPSDLEKMDELMREHCQFILKREFFKRFKIVIQELGSLDRKNFHQVTESYKNLRSICNQCLKVLEVMRDDRFFGEHDTFIEDYEKDVKIYLQILWYLAIKTDLNKVDKFLNPNTYSEGLDQNCQVFAAVSLMEQVIPHIEEAGNVGLKDKAVIELIEEYAEYLYKTITHEESQIGADGLQKLRETDRIVAEGYLHEYGKDFDLSIFEDTRDDIEESYSSLEDLKRTYAEMIRNETEVYIHQGDRQEFERILQKAALGVGVKEEPIEGKKSQDEQEKIRRVYRYKYGRGAREPETAVFVIERELDKKGEIRLLHKDWVKELYVDWKKLKKLKYMQNIIERYTENQEKTKYRIDFTIKLFKRTRFALRLGRHKRIPVPNPEGRVLRHEKSLDQTLEAMKDPIFSVFFEGLKIQYRSRYGLKLQALRWCWFAERELKEGYFEKPKYNYVKYIHTRWKEKEKEHYKTLQKLSRRDDGDDDDDD